MAAFFLVGLLVAGAVTVAEGANCDIYAAAADPGTCTVTADTFIKVDLPCAADACTEGECCRPKCDSSVSCSNSTMADTTIICAAGTCTTNECCTITRGQCQIANCDAVNGSHVLKTSDLPMYCAAASCTQAECCDSAGVCADSDCSAANMTPNVLNQFCAGKECNPARECCDTMVALDNDIKTSMGITTGSSTITFLDISTIQVGDKIVFKDGGGVAIGDSYIVTKVEASRRLDDERRLATPGTVTLNTPLTALAAAGLSLSLAPGGVTPGAVSDPITFYRGYKTKFWLPTDKLTLLLETKDIKLYVSVLEGPSEDLQWFGRFFVFKSDGSKLCEIDVNRNEIMNPDSFEQIVIKLGDSDKPLPAQIQTYGTTDGKVKFSISSMPWNTPGDYNFTQIQELVYFDTEDLVFMILPSHAGNEFPTSKALALKYTHLDFIVREMKNEHQFGGILPEFWGLKPRSNEARAMLTKPSQSRLLSGDDCGTCNGAPFWE